MDKINYQYLNEYKKLCKFLTIRLERWGHIDDPKDSWGEISNWVFCENPEPLLLFPGFPLNGMIEAHSRKIDNIVEQAKAEGVTIPLERLCDEHNLSKDEKLILAFLFFRRAEFERTRGALLLKLVSMPGDLLSKIELITSNGKLRRLGLIESEDQPFFQDEHIIFEQRLRITSKTFWTILGQNEPDESDSEKLGLRRGLRGNMLLIKEPEVSFDHLILPLEIKGKLEEALWQYANGDKVYETYVLKEKIPYGRAVAMLFYGPPGTGKTATSEAIAKQLGKKIGIANYARIYNCYVGESEKGILKAFEEAKIGDCILLFDEADSLFAQRLEEHQSVDRMHNLMTNLLMQQMEKFSGMVILTTNREVVIDTAFERRLLLKLRFDPHTPEIRAKIWHSLLKDCPQLNPDVDFEELGRYPLSGGKIKNAVIKTVMRCAKAEKPITMIDLIQSATEETKTDLGKEKEIGF
jgi:DNA polymerase III delta prime subunit